MPVDPAIAATGAEWTIGGVPPVAPPAGPPAAEGPTGFGEVLAGQLEKLGALQTQAADASMALAQGTAADPAQVVMAVERARLSMQLAAQIRTRGVDAVQELLRTQI